MAKKIETPIQIFEREYIVPLRSGWLKVPDYKRSKKAVKTLKEFMVRHMKIYDRDLRKIKIDVDLNNEIRFRGMKKPPAKILVKAKKFDNGNVYVELINLPKHIIFKRKREDKKNLVSDKKVEKKIEKDETSNTDESDKNVSEKTTKKVMKEKREVKTRKEKK